MLDIRVKPLPCLAIHNYACPCLFDDKFSERLSRKQVRHLLNTYLIELEHLLATGRYDTRPDFTVVLQPTLVRGRVPYHRPRRGARSQPNVDYLAPDCFHWAQKTHAMVARSMWNNLLEPVGAKTLHFRNDVPFLCPTKEYPYLATAINSRQHVNASAHNLYSDFNDMVQQGDGRRLECPL